MKVSEELGGEVAVFSPRHVVEEEVQQERGVLSVFVRIQTVASFWSRDQSTGPDS